MQSQIEALLAESKEAFRSIIRAIAAAETIAICAHTRPDGDALGSVLALKEIIEAQWGGPGKRVTALLADNAPIPSSYRYLPDSDTFVHAEAYGEDPDLFIAVDSPSLKRLHRAAPVCERAGTRIVIDHHPVEEPFTDIAFVRPEAAATGVIITEFALSLGMDITPDIANNLYCAICTDTGRFQYQNADAEAFAMASLLVDCGADPAECSLNVYQSFHVSYLHLQAIVMGRIITLCDGRIAYSYATLEDFAETGVDDEETDGLIDIVRSVSGTRVALFLKESEAGHIRGNLRSKDGLDISGIARKLGGGGHAAAAGFSVHSTIDEVFAQAFPLLKALVEGE